MLEVFKILIGISALILGIFIGKIIAKYTKDELDDGQIWFKALILIGLIGGIVGLIIGNDVILFTMFFIAIVTAQSLKKSKRGKSVSTQSAELKKKKIGKKSKKR